MKFKLVLPESYDVFAFKRELDEHKGNLRETVRALAKKLEGRVTDLEEDLAQLDEIEYGLDRANYTVSEVTDEGVFVAVEEDHHARELLDEGVIEEYTPPTAPKYGEDWMD